MYFYYQDELYDYYNIFNSSSSISILEIPNLFIQELSIIKNISANIILFWLKKLTFTNIYIKYSHNDIPYCKAIICYKNLLIRNIVKNHIIYFVLIT